jgi:hypothetical protein
VKFPENFNRIGSCNITKWRMRVEAQDSPEDMQKVSGGLYALSQKLAIGSHPKQASSVHSFPNYFRKIRSPLSWHYAQTFHFVSSHEIFQPHEVLVSFCVLYFLSLSSIRMCFSGLKFWVKGRNYTCSKTNLTLKSETTNILLSDLRYLLNNVVVYNNYMEKPVFPCCKECCQENRINERGDPLRWPRDTLYPQKLALTSPTSGGRSVGIVRLRTKGHGV